MSEKTAAGVLQFCYRQRYICMVYWEQKQNGKEDGI